MSDIASSRTTSTKTVAPPVPTKTQEPPTARPAAKERRKKSGSPSEKERGNNPSPVCPSPAAPPGRGEFFALWDDNRPGGCYNGMHLKTNGYRFFPGGMKMKNTSACFASWIICPAGGTPCLWPSAGRSAGCRLRRVPRTLQRPRTTRTPEYGTVEHGLRERREAAIRRGLHRNRRPRYRGRMAADGSLRLPRAPHAQPSERDGGCRADEASEIIREARAAIRRIPPRQRPDPPTRRFPRRLIPSKQLRPDSLRSGAAPAASLPAPHLPALYPPTTLRLLEGARQARKRRGLAQEREFARGHSAGRRRNRQGLPASRPRRWTNTALLIWKARWT